MVAPPSVLPSMMFVRVTGATRVSFRKPNCLSHIRPTPQKIALNKMVCAIMPGTIKSDNFPGQLVEIFYSNHNRALTNIRAVAQRLLLHEYLNAQIFSFGATTKCK